VTYLVDSNTFMEAARLYYSFDLAPGFWEWLVSESMRESIGSVEAVKEEITAGEGDLVDWAQDEAAADFWRPVTAATVEAAAALAQWAAEPGHAYTQAAVDEFLSKADFWIVAEAMATGSTVVTARRSRSNVTSRSRSTPDSGSGSADRPQVGQSSLQPSGFAGFRFRPEVILLVLR
jgi:hypothetical protein